MSLNGLGRYRLCERLGRGAYGEVFKGLDLGSGQLVALKVVRLSEEEFRAFEKEVGLLKGLSHPSVVQLLDCCRHQASAVIVLEFM
jgi:serine/threonine protein kinase